MKTIYRKIDDAKYKKLPIITPNPESETEQAGYIPPKVQIENMILAGQRLDKKLVLSMTSSLRKILTRIFMTLLDQVTMIWRMLRSPLLMLRLASERRL